MNDIKHYNMNENKIYKQDIKIVIKINIDHEVNDNTKKRILRDVQYDLESKILNSSWENIYCTAMPSTNYIMIDGFIQPDPNKPQFNKDGYNYSITKLMTNTDI